MLQFLNPIWLVAAAGIIVPVVIHLWNIRQGRVLKVGSTLLMTDATQKSASSLKISQWLLLVLRCLLIVALAMLLAQPVWQSALAGNGKGWLVLKQKSLPVLYPQYKQRIDSLVNAGYELHDFNTGLKKLSLADSSGFSFSKADTLKRNTPWSLITVMDQQLPAGHPVEIFTAGDCCSVQELLSQTGGRPQVSINLSWNYNKNPAAETPDTIAISARQLSNGSNLIKNLVTSSTGNYFADVVSTAVVAVNEHGRSILVDTSVMKVTIYEHNYPDDARYITAAIRSIADFGKYKLRLRTVQDINDIPVNQDWLFWFSEQPVPNSIKTNNLFVYQPGKPTTENSWISSGSTQADLSDPGIYKILKNDVVTSATSSEQHESVLWKDGYGNPLLRLQAGQQKMFRYYSRFNPSWSELTWSPTFPALLYQLLIPIVETDSIKANDRRLAMHEQAMPDVVRTTKKQDTSVFNNTNLDKLFWAISFLLFTSERILSFYSQKRKIA